jgi:flagellar basal-body rod modification protein FlgD
MSTINSTNPLLSAGANSTHSSSSTSLSSSSSAQQQQTAFLSLLVTQLKDQNPLDPQDGTQFVTQLAQFSSLNELVNIRTTLQGFGQPSSSSTPANVNPFQTAPTSTSTSTNSTQGA